MSPAMDEKDPLFRPIGERLQIIRKHLGLLQKEFAEKLEISTSSISDIEAGNIKPRFELIYNLTKKFNVNIYYLLHGEGDMFMPEEDETVCLVNKLSPEMKAWLKDFLRYLNQSPMVRYSMMSYFLTYKNENDLLIAKDIEKSKSTKGEQK
jgi:transcriptional regulator with XRE-family HTH domain